jgi:hypothetical protein
LPILNVTPSVVLDTPTCAVLPPMFWYTVIASFPAYLSVT